MSEEETPSEYRSISDVEARALITQFKKSMSIASPTLADYERAKILVEGARERVLGNLGDPMRRQITEAAVKDLEDWIGAHKKDFEGK